MAQRIARRSQARTSLRKLASPASQVGRLIDTAKLPIMLGGMKNPAALIRGGIFTDRRASVLSLEAGLDVLCALDQFCCKFTSALR